MTGWDKHLSGALDHFDVPPPRASLVDDIMAKAETSVPATKTSWTGSRRDRRSPWARRAMIGVAAFSLSAAAAATGWLGEPIRRLPVISSIATVIPKAVQARPITKPKPVQAVHARPKPLLMPKAKPAPVVQSPSSEPVPEAATPEGAIKKARVEAAAERIEQRLNARDARRAAHGLPSNTTEQRALLEKFKTAETPAERQAVRAEFEARRAARIEQRRARMEAHRDSSNGAGPLGRPFSARRACAEIPPGRWIPPRCRRPVEPLPADQFGDLSSEQVDKPVAE